MIKDKDTIQLDINLSKDFDGVDLELAIGGNLKLANYILVILYNKWVTKIGHSDMCKKVPDII